MEDMRNEFGYGLEGKNNRQWIEDRWDICEIPRRFSAFLNFLLASSGSIKLDESISSLPLRSTLDFGAERDGKVASSSLESAFCCSHEIEK